MIFAAEWGIARALSALVRQLGLLFVCVKM